MDVKANLNNASETMNVAIRNDTPTHDIYTLIHYLAFASVPLGFTGTLEPSIQRGGMRSDLVGCCEGPLF